MSRQQNELQMRLLSFIEIEWFLSVRVPGTVLFAESRNTDTLQCHVQPLRTKIVSLVLLVMSLAKHDYVCHRWPLGELPMQFPSSWSW